jgi:hypothetical protein
MRFATAELPFDVLTVVDSDQLLLRRGYGACIDDFLREHPGAGVLGTTAGPQPPTTQVPPAVTAWRERDLWLPYCRRFVKGEAAFPHWTFWPATVFTAAACADIVAAFDDDELARIMQKSAIFATEEVVLPTVAALHGHEVLVNPCSADFVSYKVVYTPAHLQAGMRRPDVFWVHPVPRRYDHPLRRLVRGAHHEYHDRDPEAAPMFDPDASLLLTLPILERMRRVEGWLSDSEADLLIAGLARALTDLPGPHAVVEVGSFQGRSTTVIGSVVQSLRADGSVFAIDPHDGEVGALDQGIVRTRPTLAAFTRNIASAGLSDVVTTIQKRSHEVEWERPISFLLIDRLHDYANVSRDFLHFEPWLREGAYVAFHDYADFYPGVQAFVDELLTSGRYAVVHTAETMLLARRVAAAEDRSPAPRAAVNVGSPVAAPLVSGVMPTYGRPALALAAIDRFLAQDLVDIELVIVDDSPESLGPYLPDDPRIRHLRLERRHTIGAKRNLGCEAARADVIVTWDDDDWYAPHRLRYQLQALRESGADVVGLDRLLYLHPAARAAWRYSWPPQGRPWLHDATLAFSRSFARRNPFADTNMGIDCALLWTPAHKRVVALADERIYVGIIHSGNTSPKQTSDGSWSPQPVEDVEALLGDDPLRTLGVSTAVA